MILITTTINSNRFEKLTMTTIGTLGTNLGYKDGNFELLRPWLYFVATVGKWLKY